MGGTSESANKCIVSSSLIYLFIILIIIIIRSVMSGYDNLLLTQAIGSLLGGIRTATAAASAGSYKQRVKYSTATCLDPQVNQDLQTT